MTYVVQGSEPLFNRWNEITQRLKSYNSIVQNDGELTTEEISEWTRRVESCMNELVELSHEIVVHIVSQ